jgi:hypothetical protein
MGRASALQSQSFYPSPGLQSQHVGLKGLETGGVGMAADAGQQYDDLSWRKGGRRPVLRVHVFG